MPFVNEKTYQKYADREEEFHKEYEKAVEEFKSELGREYNLIIGKDEVKSDQKFEVRVPFNRSLVLGYFQVANKEHINQAIIKAKEAFREWQNVDWKERVELSLRAAELLAREKFKLAAAISFEIGKNRYEAIAEVDETIDYFRYYAHILQENRGYIREMESRIYKNEKAYSVMRPYGVWFVISPFNFPLAITTTMSLGAIITGNTAVIKPSSDAPLSAYNLVKILLRAGFPPGVANYITGKGSEIVKHIITNNDVSGLAFTGSKEVGHKLLKEFISYNPRPVVLELGGKNAVIVTAKADLKKAVEGVVRGAFGFGAQKCSATARVYVEEQVFNDFIKLLVERVKKIEIGDPTKREVFLGPLINKDAVEKFKRFIKQAKDEGGEILIGGKVIDENNGYFVEPTVIINLPRSSELWKTEFFTPILLVEKIKDLDEGIKLANDVDYGLTAGIFSEDKKEIEYFFNNIQAGVVYANRTVGATTGAMPGVQPFGGWKNSGYTGKNAGGPYYLLSFMREQARTTYE
ncbi:MAG: aldehyde dehydrogenase family protein [Saccharolobus sp.]